MSNAVRVTEDVPKIDPAKLAYDTWYDDKLRLWVSEATSRGVAMKAIGQTKAQALASLWRQVRKHRKDG